MTKEALGLVEVRGYIGAVVAADAALKAANVSLLNVERIKAGLHTVQLVGDVGAVKAAVDSAVASISDLGCLMSSHVIPRLDSQTEILFTDIRKKDIQKPAKVVEEVIEEAVVVSEVVEEKPLVVESISEEVIVAQEASSSYSLEELEKLKVVELRSIAYREPNIGLTKKQIKFANKKTLLDALLKK
ncbi:BMC domain-containing protein [Carnobacteriaceae bacterium zg-84]|uniref:BMC domain-containing protein n=1 Tax=Granulicatella sp. zg-84 TaxID=2678503 RepID=UPI0013C04775|nr:BMC domain-containing protein [Granulicatella sp. zg-84]NEW65942.1 BMC domain-containing protein [Granulicatella sp. zg-84]QMI85167.1 BMC domain-containing protein [Carnobacteriaceae bacterium zg-84]